ncbi:hypothetical protein TNCV_2082481 [Trichonephila clavipes]|nr:hypothetical protein TNCV_2082481 [Trichonephila clavipes]
MRWSPPRCITVNRHQDWNEVVPLDASNYLENRHLHWNEVALTKYFIGPVQHVIGPVQHVIGPIQHFIGPVQHFI